MRPTDNIDATLTYDRIRDRSRTKPQEPRFDGDQPFTTLADKRQPTIYDVDQISLRLDWELDNFTIQSITTYHDSTDTVNQDFDAAATRGPTSGTSVPFAQLHTLRDQDYDVFTQEIRISGDINERLNFIAGLYYFDSELDFTQATNNVLQLPGVALGLPAGAPCAAAGLRSNDLVSAFCQLPNARSTQIAGEDVQSFALFGSLYWRPIDALEVSLGARWIDEEKDARNSYFDFSDGTYDVGGNANEFDFSGFPERAGTAYTGSDSWDDVIITAAANYAINDRSNLYVNYSEGFRSGGFSIRSARDPSEAPFDPETAFQIEAGIKNELLDRRLILNAAYFFLERDDAQFSSIIPLPPGSIPGTTTLINNGGKSTTQGLEAEMLWLIDENWSLGVNGGFIDVDNKRFSIACELVDGCVTAVPGVLDPNGTLRNLGGDSDSRQPEWNYSVTLAFDRQIGQGQFGANVIWKHNGDSLLVNTGGGADQRLIQPGYGQLSARVGYDLQRGNGDLLSIAVFGSNLTDKEWLENALFLGGPQTGFQSWGPPRLYSLEISYKFGAGTQ
ncbi:MAG: TonB-dependent receptor [Pseudomonadota bacterium]